MVFCAKNKTAKKSKMDKYRIDIYHLKNFKLLQKNTINFYNI